MPTPNTSKRQIDLDKLQVKPLDPNQDRAAFCCGLDKIDNFCRYNAKKQHAKNQVRVYDAIYDGQLVGYYYLVAASKVPDEMCEEAKKKFGRVSEAPCVYLGMIGVQLDCQSSGVGKYLMFHAMQITLRVADMVGLYALTLDALDADIAKRYARWGFEYFIEGELAMFIPIPTIRDLLNRPANPQTAEIALHGPKSAIGTP